MATQRTCRACGAEMKGNASREHILPQWLHPYIELPNVSLEHKAVNEEQTTLLRRHGLNNFVFKAICSGCNNGWMSQLEIEVKPILLPLIEEKRSADSLVGDERRIIARWAFKTAFMILSGQKTNPVPWALFRDWTANGAGDPTPAVVFALSDLHLDQGFGYTTEADDLPNAPVHPVNLRVAICIRSLLVIVLLPIDGGTRIPGRGHSLYQLLWPPDTKVIEVPTEVGPNIARPYAEFIKYLSGLVHAGITKMNDAPQ
jgi:hypothetical protein